MGILHDAAKQGNIQAMKDFLKNPEPPGATINERDLHENTPLHIASKHGYEGIVDWILEQTDVELNGLNVAGDTPLILAASYGHLEIVRKLTAKGADPNRANDHGNTALHYACFFRHTLIAEHLVHKAGAQVAVKNKYQKTPLARTSDEIKTLIGNTEETPVMAPARTFAQSKQEAKLRFLAKGIVDWEITYTSILRSPTPHSTSPNSQVFRGRWNGYEIAFKTPTRQTFTVEEIKSIRQEIATAQKLYHENLLPILAACTTSPHVGILSEWVEGTDMYTFLHDPSIEMTAEMALSIAAGVCRGLVYLHTQSPPLAHLHLASPSILLTPDLQPLLTVYGIPTLSASTNAETRYLTHAEYIAPEVLRDCRSVKKWDKVDIYALGIILHEIITREWAYEPMNSCVIGMKVVLENVRPTIPSYVPGNLAQLMVSCWSTNPDDRPTAEQCLNALVEMQI